MASSSAGPAGNATGAAAQAFPIKRIEMSAPQIFVIFVLACDIWAPRPEHLLQIISVVVGGEPAPQRTAHARMIGHDPPVVYNSRLSADA
jgi:hypothetical protein